MQINQTQNGPNFTSVIKTQVFIDGKRALSEENIRRGVRGVQHILTTPANGDQKLIAVKREFVKYVKDLNYFGEKVKNIGEVIRNIVDKKVGAAYVFTGAQAGKLNELGKKIGPEKHEALEILGETNSFEVDATTKKYFNQIKEFIENPRIRVRESINPNTSSYQGDEVVLNIYTKSQGTPDKKGFKLSVESINFENPNKKVTPQKELSKATKIRRSRTKFSTAEMPEANVRRKRTKDTHPNLPFDNNA